MRKLVAIIVLLLSFGGTIHANETHPIHQKKVTFGDVIVNKIRPAQLEVFDLIHEVVVKNSENSIYTCTVSADIIYNGATWRISSTADTCEEAGAGLAQATKAFIKEIQ